MKIFISHATPDKELATKLVELLQLGAGIGHSDIFYSSAKGSIPNGTFFVQYILSKLNAADIVVAILSRSYFNSRFCLAEAGAALARKAAGTFGFHSFVVPPVTFAELDGVLYGVQSGPIVEPEALSELRDLIIKEVPGHPSTATWDEKRKEFLKTATRIVAGYEATELCDGVKVSDVFVERTTNPEVTYKSKLRIILTNEAAGEIEVAHAAWDSTGDTLPLQKPTLLVLPCQTESSSGWETEKREHLHVASGRQFRTWIGFEGKITDHEVMGRCATRRLGKLVLRLRVAGCGVDRELSL